MHEFLDYFESGELYANEDYTTVAGLCLKELGHVPATGETFEWNSFVFEVACMNETHIYKLLVRIKNIDTNKN